ncbi:MAG: aspartate aminotransferase family protein [Opitutales bacterium]|nr:aspartate aminotransferase family protein [Opitutales bacterium]NRA26323.1 aspartate aminotransferase family protein [Opitutales bacterium]
MNTTETYTAYSLGNYPLPPALIAVKGQGSYLWDETGRRYLDMTSGIAVTSLGHSHPKWVRRVSEQAAQLVHCSNLYGNPNQAALAKRLAEQAGPGKAFFCNSGAEANEGLIKLGRLFGKQKAGGKDGDIYKIVVADTAFHGRTFGGMSATPQEKVQNGFHPLVPGFVTAEFNNIDSFAAAIDDQTAAVFIETIQGEGGIRPCSLQFLKDLRKLCDDRKVLLLIDEVQCGIGRTGQFFAYQAAGIQPDAIGMAKGLGGGFPIGAIWVSDAHAHLFTPGTHGTTFGGSPLAAEAALATLDVLEEEHIIQHVQEVSAWFTAQLEQLATHHSGLIKEVRGRGLMLALGLNEDPMPWVIRCREAGMLVVAAGHQALRLLPPLNVTKEALNECLGILDSVFSEAELSVST